MGDRIQLTPSELRSQAAEMKSLQEDYAALFSDVTSELSKVNANWSTNLAHNFGGKITSSQKSFSQITEELKNGAKVADTCAVTFESVDSQLSKMYCADEAKQYPTMLDSDKYDSLPMWIREWAKKADKKLYGKNDKLTVLKVYDAIQDGDYAKAFESLGKGFVKAYGKANGVDNYLVSYILTASKGTASAYQEYAKEPSLTNALNCFWESTIGGMLNTAADEAYDVVSLIPGISDWYEAHGAEDGGDMFNVAYTEWTRAIFGDDIADSVSTYYADNGGLFKGLVNGMGEIGNEIKKSSDEHGGIVGLWLSGWNSIFG